jgi:hypothetical protein
MGPAKELWTYLEKVLPLMLVLKDLSRQEILAFVTPHIKNSAILFVMR